MPAPMSLLFSSFSSFASRFAHRISCLAPVSMTNLGLVHNFDSEFFDTGLAGWYACRSLIVGIVTADAALRRPARTCVNTFMRCGSFALIATKPMLFGYPIWQRGDILSGTNKQVQQNITLLDQHRVWDQLLTPAAV